MKIGYYLFNGIKNGFELGEILIWVGRYVKNGPNNRISYVYGPIKALFWDIEFAKVTCYLKSYLKGILKFAI